MEARNLHVIKSLIEGLSAFNTFNYLQGAHILISTKKKVMQKASRNGIVILSSVFTFGECICRK